MFTIAWTIEILRLKPQNDIATQSEGAENKKAPGFTLWFSGEKMLPESYLG